MKVITKVHCPTCGELAHKIHLDNDIVRTSCPSCDYLMISCVRTGKVLEAYAPGLNFVRS